MKIDRVHTVAAAHNLAGLKQAARLTAEDVDIVEVRIDALADSLPEVDRLLPQIKLPILLTVRHPAEGGIGKLSLAGRKSLFLKYLPFAALVDVELRSLAALPEVIAAAKEQKTVVVASDHHFRRMPAMKELLDHQRRAFKGGADIFKLATLANTPATFARLLEFADRPSPGPRALMGMGIFGKVSRLAMATAGSVLNYGYLDQPNAPGQWEARELKKLIAKS